MHMAISAEKGACERRRRASRGHHLVEEAHRLPHRLPGLNKEREHGGPKNTTEQGVSNPVCNLAPARQPRTSWTRRAGAVLANKFIKVQFIHTSGSTRSPSATSTIEHVSHVSHALERTPPRLRVHRGSLLCQVCQFGLKRCDGGQVDYNLWQPIIHQDICI